MFSGLSPKGECLSSRSRPHLSVFDFARNASRLALNIQRITNSLEFAGYTVLATLNGKVIGQGHSPAGLGCSVSNAMSKALEDSKAQAALASAVDRNWQTTITVQFVISVDTRMPSGY